MAFKTFAPGVLTSSDVNTFLMRQAVITCTSSTRPSSPSEGMTIYETDTNLYRTYDGSNWIFMGDVISGAWTSFTPTWVNITVGNATLNEGYYVRFGNTVFLKAHIRLGSTSSIAATPNAVSLTTPTGLSATGAVQQYRPHGGVCVVRDYSVDNLYWGQCRVRGSTEIRLEIDNGSGWAGIINTYPFTWDTDDEIRLSLFYEVA